MKHYKFTVALADDDTTPSYTVIGGGWHANNPLNNMMPMLASEDTIEFLFDMDNIASLESVQLYSWPVTNDTKERDFPFACPANTNLYSPTEWRINNTFSVKVAKFSHNFVAAFAIVGTYFTKTNMLLPFLIDPEAMVSSGA